MKFTIQRETLLKPLQSLTSIVDKKSNAMAILANLLLEVKGKILTLTATDLELELITSVELISSEADGVITVPAKKLMDICRNLPEQAMINLALDENGRMIVISGRSRFLLSSLPGDEFPNIDCDFANKELQISQKVLLALLRKVHFSMAQNDVRYFLNGMLLQVEKNILKTVATDGHRLALSSYALDKDLGFDRVVQQIIPYKAVLELMRLLEDNDELLTILFGENHIRIKSDNFVITSKLVDGRYPDYSRVIPARGQHIVIVDRDTFKQALVRVAILSNEQYRGVYLTLTENKLQLKANNPEQEVSEDEIAASYSGNDIEICFNVNYLLDVLSVMKDSEVELSFAGANSSALIYQVGKEDDIYVVMPIQI